LGISAFRVSTSFDSPSCLVSTASNAVAGDNWFYVDRKSIQTDDLDTWQFAAQKGGRDHVVLCLREIEKYYATAGVHRFSDCRNAIVSLIALVGVVASMKLRIAPRTAVRSSTTRSQGLFAPVIVRDKLLPLLAKNNTGMRVRACDQEPHPIHPYPHAKNLAVSEDVLKNNLTPVFNTAIRIRPRAFAFTIEA